MSGVHRLRLIAKVLKYSAKETNVDVPEYLSCLVDVQSNSMG